MDIDPDFEADMAVILAIELVQDPDSVDLGIYLKNGYNRLVGLVHGEDL